MERIHVALIPWVGSGHVNPMVELFRKLVPLGFHVTIILTEDYHTKISLKLQQEHIDLVSIPRPHNLTLAVSHLLKESVERVLGGLKTPLRCIISDWFLGWTQDVANDLYIPRVVLMTDRARMEVICSYIPRLLSEGFLPVHDNPEDSRLITFIPGIEPLHRKQLPLVFHEKNDYIQLIGQAVGRFPEATCILVNTVEELEQEVVDARRAVFKILPVGPLLPSGLFSDEDAARSKVGLSEADISVLSWLDKHAQHTVLYIAFGSVVRLPVEQVEKIAQAVKASGQPFLWALRRNFAMDGNEHFSEEIVDRLGDQGLVVEWAPQVHVLRHEAVGALFTHCGWNSAMESICAGVPTICWPCGAEQNLNAATMVDKWKTGKKVAEGSKAHVTAEEIEGAIRAVMDRNGEGSELRERTTELMRLVRGVFAGGSSQKNLESFKNIISCL